MPIDSKDIIMAKYFVTTSGCTKGISLLKNGDLFKWGDKDTPKMYESDLSEFLRKLKPIGNYKECAYELKKYYDKSFWELAMLPYNINVGTGNFLGCTQYMDKSVNGNSLMNINSTNPFDWWARERNPHGVKSELTLKELVKVKKQFDEKFKSFDGAKQDVLDNIQEGHDVTFLDIRDSFFLKLRIDFTTNFILEKYEINNLIDWMGKNEKD